MASWNSKWFSECNVTGARKAIKPEVLLYANTGSWGSQKLKRRYCRTLEPLHPSVLLIRRMDLLNSDSIPLSGFKGVKQA